MPKVRLLVAACVSALIAYGEQGWPASLTLLPASGEGALVSFETGYSALDGVTGIYVLVGDAVDPANACMFGYANGEYKLATDDGSRFQSGAARTGILRNSRCRLDTTRADFFAVSNRVHVEFPVSFSPSFTGAKKVFVLAASANGSSGWMQKGTWLIPATPRPELVDISPVAAAAGSGDFQAIFHHAGGASRHYLSYILFLPTPNVVQFTAAGSCLIEYNRISNGVRLVNAAGTGWLGGIEGVPAGPGGHVLNNGRCSIDTRRFTAVPESETLKVNGNVSFTLNSKTPIVMGTFLQAQDVIGQWTGMDQIGSWTIPLAAQGVGPAIMGVTPGSGVSSGAEFTVVAAEVTAQGHGGESIGMLHVLIAKRPNRPASCQIVYFPQSNTINLIDDTKTQLVAPQSVTLSTGAAISNSVCTVYPAQSSGFVSSNFVQLKVRVSSTGALGNAGVFFNAFDAFGLTTHWVQGATFF